MDSLQAEKVRKYDMKLDQNYDSNLVMYTRMTHVIGGMTCLLDHTDRLV